MQNLPSLEVMQCAIRTRICVQCYQRPEGSESQGPTVPRECEPQCTIFIHLPTLRQIVDTTHDPALRPYETAIYEMVCQQCEASPTSGDFCADRTTQSCPLSRYTAMVIDTLERLPQPHDSSSSTT